MSARAKLAVEYSLLLIVLFGVGLLVAKYSRPAHADDPNEVKPYCFAELPHGRICKAVHEGCELYIVESDYHPSSIGTMEHTYTITTGRGCK